MRVQVIAHRRARRMRSSRPCVLRNAQRIAVALQLFMLLERSFKTVVLTLIPPFRNDVLYTCHAPRLQIIEDAVAGNTTLDHTAAVPCETPSPSATGACGNATLAASVRAPPLALPPATTGGSEGALRSRPEEPWAIRRRVGPFQPEARTRGIQQVRLSSSELSRRPPLLRHTAHAAPFASGESARCERCTGRVGEGARKENCADSLLSQGGAIDRRAGAAARARRHMARCSLLARSAFRTFFRRISYHPGSRDRKRTCGSSTTTRRSSARGGSRSSLRIAVRTRAPPSSAREARLGTRRKQRSRAGRSSTRRRRRSGSTATTTGRSAAEGSRRRQGTASATAAWTGLRGRGCSVAPHGSQASASACASCFTRRRGGAPRRLPSRCSSCTPRSPAFRRRW